MAIALGLDEPLLIECTYTEVPQNLVDPLREIFARGKSKQLPRVNGYRGYQTELWAYIWRGSMAWLVTFDRVPSAKESQALMPNLASSLRAIGKARAAKGDAIDTEATTID